MIRNLMLGMSLVTLSTVSAFAAAPATTHHAKAKVVAQAPAPEASTPSADKPVKKSTKKASAPKKVKGDTKMESKSDGKSGEIAPATEKAPAPAAK
ncbi:MAG TPA: hypothetical protein VFH68_13220 [Polyangia bacterium]|jgi:hypothetical protein|nr:hypothetical protein [Polyangia bacterium]